MSDRINPLGHHLQSSYIITINSRFSEEQSHAETMNFNPTSISENESSQRLSHQSIEMSVLSPSSKANGLLPVNDSVYTIISRLKGALNTQSTPTKPWTFSQIFHEVLKAYEEVVFTPIAKIIGLTPEATLRMALGMGITEIRKVASNTQKPFCGHSIADFIRLGPARAAPEKKGSWSIKELACLSALYTKYANIPQITDRVGNVRDCHYYHHEYTSIERHLKELHEMPWIAEADHRRLAHEFQERRVEAGKAVARKFELDEEDVQLFENVLFDRAALRSYGYSAYSDGSIWRPRHISREKHINDLMRIATLYQNNFKKSPLLQYADWLSIVHTLFDNDGPQLYPVLKRFALGPVPDEALSHQEYNTTEHAGYRERLVSCILEAFRS